MLAATVIMKVVQEPEVNSPSGEQPVVLIPVTAEDVSRQQWRVRLSATVIILAILAAAGFIYKRSMDPLNAQESFDAGSRLFKIARYNQAILSFDRAIALKPDMTDAYLMRGKSNVGDARPEQALPDFTKVIELRPSDPAAWIERGAAYLELNNYRAAISDASHAIALNQSQAASYNLRGAALRKSGDPQKALEDFNRAVELAPTADNYYQRGATYQLLGEHRLAIKDFDQVIKIIPDLANAFFARAASRRAIGDIAAAQSDHRQGRILDGH
jgi:tetratricopeptide (TPR) repeat protein